jgi:hypothetical protein
MSLLGRNLLTAFASSLLALGCGLSASGTASTNGTVTVPGSGGAGGTSTSSTTPTTSAGGGAGGAGGQASGGHGGAAGAGGTGGTGAGGAGGAGAGGHGGTGGSGGVGGSGGTSTGGAGGGTGGASPDGGPVDDAGLDGGPDGGGVLQSCAGLNVGMPSGTYKIAPDPNDPGKTIDVWCDTAAADGPWTMLFNSVGSADGSTQPFWAIAYSDRLSVKGTPSLTTNYYAGSLYVSAQGGKYKDEVEDVAHQALVLFRATAAGFDPVTMRFVSPTLATGDPAAYAAQFASGWSSSDYHGDLYVNNCAVQGGNVTQHYSACAVYSLGGRFGPDPVDDSGWGPHVDGGLLKSLGLSTDGKYFSRVTRITRWVKW